MKQYEIYFTNEYVNEIINELALVFELRVEKIAVNNALKEKDVNSISNIIFLKKEDNIIIVDCNNKDWIFSLVVLCDDTYADKINKILLKWDNMIREEYGQEETEEINNVFGKANTLLENIEKYYKIKLA